MPNCGKCRAREAKFIAKEKGAKREVYVCLHCVGWYSKEYWNIEEIKSQ
jgi:protein-arginine kinase activator protein McsA